MAHKKDKRSGYGKLLDCWSSPEMAGGPVGCVATSFTFDPVFFEEECLSRFLRLETDAAEDGPLYLIEREEKLAQVVCAAALIDQHHCRGSRSLRWDLLPARLTGGLLHAKISVLYWQHLVRLIVASANLTEDGYRRNLEVFGTLDYHEGGEEPLKPLTDVLAFLGEAARYAGATSTSSGPALGRWAQFLEQVRHASRMWGTAEQPRGRDASQVRAVLVGPGRRSALESMREAWPGQSPAIEADVFSPFFDPPEAPNLPAKGIWNLVRQRGESRVCYFVTAEEVEGEEALFLHAPESLKTAQPADRPKAETRFNQLDTSDGEDSGLRPLHAKGIWLEDDRWSSYMVGSSNFTTAGLGLGRNPNLEANLIYSFRQDGDAYRAASEAFPRWFEHEDGTELRFQPLPDGDSEGTASVVLLPTAMSQATYRADAPQQAFIDLAFDGTPPTEWAILTEDGSAVFYDEAAWRAAGASQSVSVPWAGSRPPSGILVCWRDSGGTAWWPVNVASPASLPPPEELRDLPLEVLIDILTSARPLHQAMRAWVRRWKERGRQNEVVELDPLKYVDTSTFLLQRTRRVSWALTGLRQRLERPAPTEACLEWRLRGPVGATALATALEKEARSDQEKCFLLAELALELARARPQATVGGLKPAEVRAAIGQVIDELKIRICADALSDLHDLAAYVRRAFEKATA